MRVVSPLPQGATPAPAAVVVGVGCSAGGLEALEALLSGVPPDSGLALVVVQHLDPTRPSGLAERLQHMTPLTVVEAVDGVVPEAGHVYVIAPNTEIVLSGGALRISPPTEPRGLRSPIDLLFRSLAAELLDQAVAVLLSGMGSDGLLGFCAIREAAGLTLAQEPASAREDAMPRAVIEAGVVDVVGAPALLVPRLLEARARRASLPEAGLDAIVALLRQHSGADFSMYKPGTLHRRIARRIAIHQLDGVDAYIRYLQGQPEEIELLQAELLIGVTQFFRDPSTWEVVATELRALLARTPAGRMLRAWVPACSTGEEAYSLAIAFLEAAGDRPISLQIYATDLDAGAIARARKAVYPGTIAADLSPERLARCFVPDGVGYRVAPAVREKVMFAVQNVLSDPPFTRLDVLSCRNLLIYLSAAAQQRILPMFHHALNADGLLLLGTAEGVGLADPSFSAVHPSVHLYRRVGDVSGVRLSLPPSVVASEPPHSGARPVDTLGQLTDRILLSTYAPAAVLVNTAGDILYVSGRSGRYLEAPAGKMNVNLHAMARTGLREALVGALRAAVREGTPRRLSRVSVDTGAGFQFVDVVVQPLHTPGAPDGRLLVVFQDVSAGVVDPHAKNATPVGDLEQAREALRLLREEMSGTVEELRANNEELQAANEELQSTNEELTTSKEEMQSLNEELQTVNAELEGRVTELTSVRNDMANLLDSTEIATIFLDDALHVRRYTPPVSRLFRLIAGDIGRPLSHVVTDLDYPTLREDVLTVLRTLVFQERQARTPAGEWFRVRVMPYRTTDGRADGVVMTFIDITEVKRLEALVAAAHV